MSKLSRLQAKLTRIDARIANIEAAYPKICEYKQYSVGHGKISTAYQEFGPVAHEYHRLLSLKDATEDVIDELQGDDSAATAVAVFRGSA